MICHHILESRRYEFGLGLWRQSSAGLANTLQGKMIIFIAERHRVDRGIRANKPWWFIGYHSSHHWKRQQMGFYLLPKILGYAGSWQRMFSVRCCCFLSSRAHPGVINWPVSNISCTAGMFWLRWAMASCSTPAGTGCHHGAAAHPQCAALGRATSTHHGHKKHRQALPPDCLCQAWRCFTRAQTCCFKKALLLCNSELL